MNLPYEFDTAGVVKRILRLIAGLLGVVVVLGIPYSLFVSRNRAAALLLLLIGTGVALFGRLVLAHLAGSQGTITSEAVVVRPATLYGLRLAGGAGTFPIRHFEAVRVEQSSGSVDAQSGTHELVSLVGRGSTPDILIARTEGNDGKSLGRGLATALGLAYEERPTPY